MSEVECGFTAEPAVVAPELLVREGPVIAVDVGFNPRRSPGGAPFPASRQVQALLDTGATDSCVDETLARELQLPEVDQKKIIGIGGGQDAILYSAQIHAPDLDFTQYGYFSGVNLSDLPYGALIGRRFLREFKMVYNGTTGSVIISHP